MVMKMKLRVTIKHKNLKIKISIQFTKNFSINNNKFKIFKMKNRFYNIILWIQIIIIVICI